MWEDSLSELCQSSMLKVSFLNRRSKLPMDCQQGLCYILLFILHQVCIVPDWKVCIVQGRSLVYNFEKFRLLCSLQTFRSGKCIDHYVSIVIFYIFIYFKLPSLSEYSNLLHFYLFQVTITIRVQ